MEEKIYDLFLECEANGRIDCEEDIRQMLKENGIHQCKISVHEAFDYEFEEHHYNVTTISVAWIENGSLKLIVESIDRYWEPQKTI